ncbi:hypothetical protein BJV77DRAFT_1066936 [Russula vinacea]|nr:hypothetical protein BJV77DRAFT_1066936 [Russula vinacea]
MSSAAYQALPSDDYDEEQSPVRHRHIREHRQLAQDPRFNPPTPSWWKRALRGAEEEIIHAQRCIFKATQYRPAASPVITEKLKGGKTRVRGAGPSYRSF